MAERPRYPERTSSLSAIDFPHGPPNSPSKLDIALVPDEEIPPITLKEETMDVLQRSLSEYEIREPMVEEFTFEPLDRTVNADIDNADGELSPAAFETENTGGSLDIPSTIDGDINKEIIEDPKIENVKNMKDINLSSRDEAPTEEETYSKTNSRSSSPVETPPSTIVRPATPMIPLVFGRKNKDANNNVIDSKDALEICLASPAGAVTTQTTVGVPGAENFKENHQTPAQLAAKKETFFVAISGCSSAGKSLLAKILSEIFESISVLSSNGEGGKIKSTITIAQDDFFHPKGLQPFVSFASTPGDWMFMEKSIQHDEVGMYFITSSGTRPSYSPDALLECATGTCNTPRTDSFDSNSGSTSRLLEGGHRPCYQVTGPMPDCNQALDFVGLVEAISNIATSGQAPDYKKRFPCEEDMSEYSGLVTKMKEKVMAWVKKQAILNAEARFGGAVVRAPIESDGKTINDSDPHGKGKARLRPQFVFVEGFLLLADTSTIKPAPLSNTNTISSSSTRRLSSASPYKIAIERAKITKYIKQLKNLSSELTAKNNIDESIEGERDVIEAQFWATNLKAKDYLQGFFDVKLFLNTSKGESKRRRFERSIYRDAPEGGRLPGQMWKSEGFFEEVVWSEFERAHEWLLEDYGETHVEGEAEKGKRMELFTRKGVFFEPVQDAGVDDVVEWAVDAMLAKMGQIEAEARVLGGGYSTDD